MKSPDISVIVPVYNSEKYIHECLSSILRQTFKNIEIILIDDGSIDQSGVICDQYEKLDSRIRVIHQKNKGASHARNVGVKNSVGRYICFVDSDDLVEETYCETMFRLLEDSNYDFSVCGSYRFTATNKKIASYNGVEGVISNEEYLWAQLHKKSEFGFINKLFRRKIFDELRFVEGVHNEDVIFSCDLARKFKMGVICTNKELYAYRMNECGVTFGQKENADPDFIHAARYLIETAEIMRPELLDDCLLYAIGYPWFFIDKIYLEKSFKKNKIFLHDFREQINKYSDKYSKLDGRIDAIKKHRILLFAKSPILYAINVYTRLARLYIFKILNKDPYASGHGI